MTEAPERTSHGSRDKGRTAPAPSDLKIWLSDRWLVRRLYDLVFCRGDFIRTIAQRPIVHKAIGPGSLGCVLDNGCGRGMYTSFLRKRARLMVGIDLSEDHVRTMVRRNGPDPRVRVLRASADALPFRDATFDLVLCTEVFEHVRDDRGVMAEVARVLTPAGRAIISVPVPPAPIVDAEHVREGYTYAEIEPMLFRAGLEVEKVQYCLFGISRLAMRIEAWYSAHAPLPLPSLFKLPLYLERLGVGRGWGAPPYDLILEVKKQGNRSGRMQVAEVNPSAQAFPGAVR